MEEILNRLEILLKSDGIHVVQILVTLVGGIVLSNFVCSLLRRLLQRRDDARGTGTGFIVSLVRIGLYLGVFFATAVEMGIPPDSILAEFGIITVAVSLALKDTIASLANGIMILTTKPFRQGDHIEAGGVEGIVKGIHLFYTELLSFDNRVLSVPNQSVVNGKLINDSRMPTRRVEVTAEVAYGSDLDTVKRTLSLAISRVPHILKTPPPFVRMTEMGASSLVFTVRIWTYTDQYFAVKADLTEEIYRALCDADISIPFPQMDVHLPDLPNLANVGATAADAARSKGGEPDA
jgi:small conductance mechanosensitive channel